MQVHGNVCLASVVVTQTLDWKLHAFDVLSEFDGNNEMSNGPMLVILILEFGALFSFCFRLLVIIIALCSIAFSKNYCWLK